jgi:purine-cytosine permease-like protein
MNRTQKSAWMLLAAFLLDALGLAYVGSIFVWGRMPPRLLGHIGAVLVPLAVVTLAVLLFTRRQSRAEPESDERDKMIIKNAALIGLLTGWLLLALRVLILGVTLGQTGSMPVYVLTLLLFGVFFFIVTPVYAVAILVQYGREVKDER